MPWTVTNARPDLFSAPVSVNINARDSVHGDSAIVLAQACADTLAFENRGFFIELCKGAVIPSFYTPVAGPTKVNFDFKYDEFLNFKKAPEVKKSAVLTSQNICAYNNFRIRTWFNT